MKKLLASVIILVTATSALAHSRTRCRTTRNRHGNRVETCRTVNHSHRHHRDDNYGDGFFDGMITSTLILFTISNSATDDYNRDFLESEISFALAASGDQQVELSIELQNLVDETREVNQGVEISDEEILTAYLLELSK